jgi:hypothetical protein
MEVSPVSDDELQATPYAQLWLSELGAYVPEHRSTVPALPPPGRGRRRPALPTPPAPDPMRRDRRE